jgi:hypothetical protein
MNPRGQLRSTRKLVWVERQHVEGCSECLWVFNPSGPPVGNSMHEMRRNFEVELSKEFASHACIRASARAQSQPK